jgi:hypothetical protein
MILQRHHITWEKEPAVRRDFFSIVLFAHPSFFAHELQARALPLLYISMQRPSWIMERGGNGEAERKLMRVVYFNRGEPPTKPDIS